MTITYITAWNGRDDEGIRVANGTYLYKMSSGRFNSTRKMTLIT